MRNQQIGLLLLGFFTGSALVLVWKGLFATSRSSSSKEIEDSPLPAQLGSADRIDTYSSPLINVSRPLRHIIAPPLSTVPDITVGKTNLTESRATVWKNHLRPKEEKSVKTTAINSSVRHSSYDGDVLSDRNVFISLAVKAVKEPERLVLFSGKTTKRLLDRAISNLTSMVSLNGKVHTRTWSDIARLVNTTFNNPRYNSKHAVHVHNEHKLGDLLEHIVLDYKKQSSTHRLRHSTPPREVVHKILDLAQVPIVITNSIDENWGFLSTGIGSRTTMWINMTNHLLIHGADYSTVRSFLDSDKVLLVVCNTHVDPQIGAHEKIISLPLGISRKGLIFSRALELSKVGVNKTTLLQINNSGWGDRAFINRIVSEAFNGTVTNTYKGANTDENRERGVAKKKRQKREREMMRGQGLQRRLLMDNTNTQHTTDHYLETAQAKFVICPSGLGYDTYRLWETLLLGSIPIVESNEGFDRTYSSLPVLVVRNYSDVTPALLNRAYSCFVRNAFKFQFNHLTEEYWIDIIAKAVRIGSVQHITEQHPFKNRFCSFF